MKGMKAVFAAGLLMALGTTAANAVPIVDQTTGLGPEPISAPIFAGQSVAQTVTVGVGGFLYSIDLQLRRNPIFLGDPDFPDFPSDCEVAFACEDLTVLIREVNGDSLGSTLASLTLSIFDIPLTQDFLSWTSFDLSGEGLLFDAGDMFAIQLERPNAPDRFPLVGWTTSGLDGYLGGQEIRFLDCDIIGPDSPW